MKPKYSDFMEKLFIATSPVPGVVMKKSSLGKMTHESKLLLDVHRRVISRSIFYIPFPFSFNIPMLQLSMKTIINFSNGVN